ncbi:hypothetical protein VOLCADRAFT_89141 [Volvox carteri f. nagariensis]|uniref:Uncharacterized protein n=1 Tax=Volvox carteri f. nagariensis TaxID=3068 RepID=D8TQW7_VOLCA|nr:uncharacterized protein VOLCADRAFT_89141 [Volvox carteri f. nagariensis]EFJ50228.1 hypothetical protein VOLCADRAFT_89141 [Volvox carteri f. nagariensis]|eukprot:XP_002948848.1 hypothetical protein VOLCADRAFT_89141 [Volvox carteri f. nagariensis]
MYLGLYSASVRAATLDGGGRRRDWGYWDTPAKELKLCYNALYSANPTNFSDFLDGSPSKRLKALAAQCRSYPSGPLAAAVYLPLVRREPWEGRQANGGTCDGTARTDGTAPISDSGTPTPHEPNSYSAGGGSTAAAAAAATAGACEPRLSESNAAALRNATATLEALFRDLDAQPPPAPSYSFPSFLDLTGAAGGSRAVSNANATAAAAAAAAGADADAGATPAATAIGACVLRLMLLYELVADEVMAALMPINALRNAAILAADTPLVAMVDVDLSPSLSLSQHLLSNRTRAAELQRRAEAERTVWVIPAFDTQRRLSLPGREAVADLAVAVPHSAKGTRLVALWKKAEKIYPFAYDVYRAGHSATDYNKWFRSKLDYQVSYRPGYEPWFIGARMALPAYDARFRGYSWNKVTNVRHVAALRFSFWVITDSWLVHRPHAPTASCTVCTKEKPSKSSPPLPSEKVTTAALDKRIRFKGKWHRARDAFIRRAKGFYQSAVDLMRQGNYEPVTDVAWRNCRRVLSWWQQRDGGDASGAAGNASAAATAR